MSRQVPFKKSEVAEGEGSYHLIHLQSAQIFMGTSNITIPALWNIEHTI